MKNLIDQSKIASKSLGKVFYGPTENEKKYLIYRRSIYVSKNVKKGEKLSKENTKIIRPSLGMKPKLYWSVLNKKFRKNIKKGTPLKKEFLI